MNIAPVAPSRASVVGGYAGGRVAQPPMSTQNRSVVTRTAPPPAQVPFAQRQRALSANPGRPLDSSEVQQLRSSQQQAAPSFVRPSRVGTIPQVQQPTSPQNYPQQAQPNSPRNYPPQPRPQGSFPPPQREASPRIERTPQQPPAQPVAPQREVPQRVAPPRDVPQVRPERQAPERQAPPARQVQRDQRREERKDERDKKQ
jgi:hypothetical protein